MAKKGALFLAGSFVFMVGTISLVLWDIRRQEKKRTGGVRLRMAHTEQQYQNLAEYMEQKRKLEEYKDAAMQRE